MITYPIINLNLIFGLLNYHPHAKENISREEKEKRDTKLFNTY